jgi:hypothetical protein
MNTVLRGLLVAALALTSHCDGARAWSDPGHKVICEIAFRLAHQDTQAAIRRLLELDTEFKTFSDSCVFPDHPRIRASELHQSAAKFQGADFGRLSEGRQMRTHSDLE